MKKTTALQYMMIYSLLLLAVAWSIYPILRVITISIRPGDNLLNESLSIIPEDWTFDNYIRIFKEHPMGTWIWNYDAIDQPGTHYK
jgi:ABC-type glycerol-3-phosphate transport system permease component